MGSDSDEPVMRESADALDEFGIDWEMRVLLRAPHPRRHHRLRSGRQGSAASQVLIAGAGGAAHLAGRPRRRDAASGDRCADSARNAFDGLDSLLSMAQMPRGVPVATVAIGGAATPDCSRRGSSGSATSESAEAVVEFQERLAAEVRAKDAALQERLSQRRDQAT